MFLTTNRVSAFDQAFKPRIHLTINYPDLDLSSSKLVWQAFVRPVNDGSSQYANNTGQQDLEVLVAMDMNGRDIKNTVKAARLLATRRGVPLAVEHINSVLRMNGMSTVANSI